MRTFCKLQTATKTHTQENSKFLSFPLNLFHLKKKETYTLGIVGLSFQKTNKQTNCTPVP